MKILAITSLSFLVLLSACRKDAPPQDPDALLQLMVGTWELEELEYHFAENSTYRTDNIRENVESHYEDVIRANSIFLDKKGRLQTNFNLHRDDTTKFNEISGHTEEEQTIKGGGKMERVLINIKSDGTFQYTTTYIHDEPSSIFQTSTHPHYHSIDTIYQANNDTLEQSASLYWEFNDELFIDLRPNFRLRSGINFTFSLLFGQIVSIDEKCMVLEGSQHWNYVALNKRQKYSDSLDFPDYYQFVNTHSVSQAVGHQVWKRVKE